MTEEEEKEYRDVECLLLVNPITNRTFNFFNVASQLDEGHKKLIFGRSTGEYMFYIQNCCQIINLLNTFERTMIYFNGTTIHMSCNNHLNSTHIRGSNLIHISTKSCRDRCLGLFDSSLMSITMFFKDQDNIVVFPDAIKCKNCSIMFASLFSTNLSMQMHLISQHDGTSQIPFIYAMCRCWIYCLNHAHTAKFVLSRNHETLLQFISMCLETIYGVLHYIQKNEENRNYTECMVQHLFKTFIAFITLLLQHSKKYIKNLYKIYKEESQVSMGIHWLILRYIKMGDIPFGEKLIPPLIIFYLLFEKKECGFIISFMSDWIETFYGNDDARSRCMFVMKIMLYSDDATISYDRVLYHDGMVDYIIKVKNLSLSGNDFKKEFNKVLSNNPTLAQYLASLQDEEVFTNIYSEQMHRLKQKSSYKQMKSISSLSKILSVTKNMLRFDYIECQWRNCHLRRIDLEANERTSWKKCSKCRIARYCSKSHQKKDWNIGDHKNVCCYFDDSFKGKHIGKAILCEEKLVLRSDRIEVI
eukprot:249577_1